VNEEYTVLHFSIIGVALEPTRSAHNELGGLVRNEVRRRAHEELARLVVAGEEEGSEEKREREREKDEVRRVFANGTRRYSR
tara:strand:- start:205 stop:450 length:246 start_codon:yes stop_codon:yes gene_type:complete